MKSRLTRSEFLSELKLSSEDKKELINYTVNLEMFMMAILKRMGIRKGNIVIDAGTGDKANLASVLSMIIKKMGW